MSYRIPCALAPTMRDDRSADVTGDDSSWFLPAKASADVGIAAILLVLAAPVILALVVLVRLTSRGPAIFRQVRLGRDGRPYELLKIRSMTHDCERATGPRWATTNDARVTPLGRFLRRSHLDELPQLWNVVRGEMSLVGPRPERPEFVAKLEAEIPGYRDRLMVNPGITGLAQVQLPPDGNVDDVRRKVAHDLCYIRQMGPLLDLKILVGTTLKIAGVPFDVTRQVLALPGVVEDDRDGDGSRLADPASLPRLRSA